MQCQKGERTETTRSESKDRVLVYTTPYGTRYVLPIDLLFSPEEIERFTDEALTKRYLGENGD
jgi:hypothetical protein